MGCLELYTCSISCYHNKIKTSISKSHTTVWTAQYSLDYKRQKATKAKFESCIQARDDPWGDTIHQILPSRTIPIWALSLYPNIFHYSPLFIALSNSPSATPHTPTPYASISSHALFFFLYFLLLQERAPSVLSTCTCSSILPSSFFFRQSHW